MSLIKCPKCGEMFSDSYKACPFCAEDEAYYNGRLRKSRGRRAAEAPKRRAPSILGPAVIVVLVLLVVLVVWLLFGEQIRDVFTAEKPPVTDVDGDKTNKTDKSDTPDDQPVVPAMSLNRTVLVLTVGDSESLTVSGTEESASWESSDPTVVSVTSGGAVKALAKGNAVITARVGEESATCTVTVKEEGDTDTDTNSPPDNSTTPDSSTKPTTNTNTNTKVDVSKLKLVTPFGTEVPYDTVNERFDVTLSVGNVCKFTVKGTTLTPVWSCPSSSVGTVTSDGEVTATGKGEVTMTIKLGSTEVDFLLRVR